MSKKDQGKSHNWKKRVKDWLLIPQSSSYGNPHDVTGDELAKHHTRTDCWMAIDGLVYDVSRFVPYHPGGTKILEMYAGRDATAPFSRNHVTKGVLAAIENFLIGRLVEGSAEHKELSEDRISAGPPPCEQGTEPTPSSSTAPPITTTIVTTVEKATTALDGNASSPLGGARSEVDVAAEAFIGLNRQQLMGVVQNSQLFQHMSSEAVAATIDDAVMSQTRGGVDDEAALRELFAALDTTSRGYVTRLALRDFFYRLEPDGVAEETLLRAPEQITFAVFLKLFKQL